jgi:FMN-dependent oxidoreductase (nitrilotriacetate monooxygenase family)
MVTGNSVRAAQNFGLAELAEHDLRYEMADEFMAAVYALWDSWEPDAIVADLDSGLFADPAKVHRVDFEGEWFRTRGPLNSGPAPQGRPVIAQAGASPRGRQFAAQHADTIVGAGRTASAMKAYRDDVRARAERIGRNPDEIKVLFNIMPIIGATERDAAERMDILRARAQAQPELHLAALSKLTNNDLSVFPMDEPLDPAKLSTNGSQWGLPQFIEQNEGRTLREAAVIGAMSFPGAGGLVGTPAQVAGRMSEMMDEAGGDGFLIVTDELNRRTIAELTEGLVPELQRLGVVRREYEHAHLRDTLREF